MDIQSNHLVDVLRAPVAWGRISWCLVFLVSVAPPTGRCQTGRGNSASAPAATTDSMPAEDADGMTEPAAPETDSTPSPEASPRQPLYQPLLDDVRASSFQNITPGTTAEAELERQLGKPLSRRQERDETVYQFRVGPFPQVEVAVRSGIVVRVIVSTPRSLPLDQVTRELRLGEFSPVTIVDDAGKPLAIAYPERGVMLMLTPSGAGHVVPQLVLESIAAEPFWRRAESDTTHAWENQLRDLDYAVKLDPGCGEAHWRKAEILLAAGQADEALAAIDQALQHEPESSAYRLTRALILAESGQARDAAVDVQRVFKDAQAPPYVRGFAYHQLATLLVTPPKSQVTDALKHRLSAVQLLAPAASDPRVVLRRQARLLLVHVYLQIAQDVATGPWSDKPEAVNKWLRGAGEIAEALIEQDGADEWVRFLVLRHGLAAHAAHGQIEATLQVEPALELGQTLIERAQDKLYQRSLKRDYARLLFDAALIAQAQGDVPRSRELAAKSVALCEETLHDQPLSPCQQAWIGRLYFEVGSQCALRDGNHREAIRWYERALPLLSHVAPSEPGSLLGEHGERLVSMGVSYWQAGAHTEAVKLSEEGLDAMVKTAQAGHLERRALVVPYSNLSSMYTELGKSSEARKMAVLASKAEQESSNQN